MLTASNYTQANEVLRHCFGNQKLIISRHKDSLMTVEAVTSNNNMKGVCYLYDSIESLVRGLESLGVSAETYGSLLSSVLINKLISELRLIIGRKVRDEEWNLSAIL